THTRLVASLYDVGRVYHIPLLLSSRCCLWAYIQRIWTKLEVNAYCGMGSVDPDQLRQVYGLVTAKSIDGIDIARHIRSVIEARFVAQMVAKSTVRARRVGLQTVRV